MDRVWCVHRNSSHEPTTPDVLIAEIAARQHGVVTLVQLLGAGLDHTAIAYRRRVGRLHLLHRGVYAVGHRPPSPLTTAIAAVLACGPDAALSHRSAGALWRILTWWHAPTELTTPTKRGHPGIHVHRSRHIETTAYYGIQVTTPARTLVDLADVLTPNQLTRAVNEARVRRLVTPAELTTLLTRYPGRRTARLTPSGAPPARTSKTASRASSTPPPAAPRAKPTDRRPRSRRRLPRTEPDHRARQPPVPHHPTSLRARPRPRCRPPQRGVLHGPHHRPTPQPARHPRGPAPQPDPAQPQLVILRAGSVGYPTGIFARSRVPRPAGLSSHSVPSSAASRSSSPRSPEPLPASAPPTPSSATSIVT